MKSVDEMYESSGESQSENLSLLDEQQLEDANKLDAQLKKQFCIDLRDQGLTSLDFVLKFMKQI